MVHAIEAYTSAHLKNPISDMLAVRALELLSQNLMLACDNGHDHGAREAMLLGAMFAGQAFANSPVAAVHALAYPIGGIFHVAHGLSNALVLPHVMKFNAPAASKLYAELADVILPGTTGSCETKTAALIAHIEGLVLATGIPRTLREVGVKEMIWAVWPAMQCCRHACWSTIRARSPRPTHSRSTARHSDAPRQRAHDAATMKPPWNRIRTTV
jgi:alcohol dehydrogenase